MCYILLDNIIFELNFNSDDNLEEGELDDDGEQHPMTTVTKIDPSEIPEVCARVPLRSL